jgi:hypothetical protein
MQWRKSMVRNKHVVIVATLFVVLVSMCGSSHSQVEINFAAAVTAPWQCLTTAPITTRSIGIAVNLQADSPILPAFDPADPAETSNYSSSVTIYGNLAFPHVVTIYFKKIAEGIWEWYARASDPESLPTDPDAGSGTLAFTADGLLQPGSGAPADLVFLFYDVFQAISLVLDGSFGCSATTQYPLVSSTICQTQDGYPPWSDGLISPDGGEVWGANSTHIIEWCGVGEGMKVKAFFSMDNGTSWEQVGTDFVTTTSMAWDIPSISKRNKKCRVKVAWYNRWDQELITHTSEKPFTIDVAEVQYPISGETFVATHDYTITWASSSAVEPVHEVRLYYSRNGSTGWRKIDTITGNPGIYNWTVPQPKRLSTKCKVKVVLLNDKGKTVGKAVSQGYFAIQP